MKHIKIIGILFMSVMITGCGGDGKTKAIQEISPNEALAMTEESDVQMIDVREADEIEKLAYDVDNILTIPLSDFEARLNEIPKDKKIIVTCRTGNRSMKAANILLEHKFTSIYNMTGGILSWEESGFDVISSGSCCSDPSSSNCNPDGTCKDNSNQ